MIKSVLPDETHDLLIKQNKIKVLEIIRNQPEITRSQIIQLSGLSAPTVTRIVENLVNQQLIVTEGIGLSIGGRPPQIIRFNGKQNFVIGIDLGATYIRSALSNLDGEFIYEIQVQTNLKKGFDGVMQQMGELVTKLTERAQKQHLNLWGIGVAVCGMVNKQTCLVEYSPIFGWKNVDVKKALSQYTQLNIALGNVTHLVALGEMLYGAGKKYKNFICINLGYGIGSGIIADGKLFTGAHGIAGEIGHVVIDKYSQLKGSEGINGTLEALASGYGIADIARTRMNSYHETLLHSFTPDDIDARKVFEAATNGDLLATQILEEVAEYISIGIDTLIKLFNTECIVLSGGLMQNGPMLLDKIAHRLPTYSMHAPEQQIPVIASSNNENAALMGSFSLILEKILQLELS